MVKAKIFNLKSGKIIGFEISGHSGFAAYGKDIVCAAISSAAYMTINIVVELLKVSADVKINENEGHMRFRVSEDNALKCKLVFEGLKLHLILLEEIYPKNLKVSYEEVQENV